MLGLTVEHLWEKLGEHIGPERVAMIRGALDTLTGVWAFIQDVQREGLPAIWRFIAGPAQRPLDTLLSMATEWIMQTIVVNATVKLLCFLDPTGIMAVINGCIAFFNAVMSAIEYLHDMLEVLNLYVSTLAAVAAGNIVPGAADDRAGLASDHPDRDRLPREAGRDRQRPGQDRRDHRRPTRDDRPGARLADRAGAAAGAGGAGRARSRREEEPADEEPAAAEEEGAIHEPFDLAGQDDEIYTGASGTLMVASNGGQAVTSLQQLTSLHNDYTALPATATDAERRRIIRAMIALIRQDPSLLAQLADQGLGDAPSLGDVRPHRGQPPRFQPRGGSPSYAALWELESEHVIPQSYVNALFAAFSLSPCRRRSTVGCTPS